MKGVYKTKEGSKVEVIDFDEANKIAMIKVDELQNRWVDESEYKQWESIGETIDEPSIEEPESEDSELGEESVSYEPTTTSEEIKIEEEKPSEPETKRKRIYKKKGSL